jgi:hypothetical protein
MSRLSDSGTRLGALTQRWSARHAASFAADGPGAILLGELAASIDASGAPAQWQRRPSLSFDGTPLVLSCKLAREADPALRVLVEPGHLGMTVAQQVACALTRLDGMLGRLGWRQAVAQINAIASCVFPHDAADTAHWWGGIWLGASVAACVSAGAESTGADADLRLYLNLRHGDASARWRRLRAVLAAFAQGQAIPGLPAWMSMVAEHAIPVGLGMVVSAAGVIALRVYVGVATPSLAVLTALAHSVDDAAVPELATVHDGFTDRFGPMPAQSVTAGFDFLRSRSDVQGQISIRRTKFDLCCDLIDPARRPLLLPWIRQLLADQALDAAPLATLLGDIDAIWGGSRIQFLSLGFQPRFDHLTVYVLPQ